MAVSDQEVKAWLDKQPVNDLATVRAMQEYGVSPEQIARVTMIPLDTVNSRIEAVVNDVYGTQFGRGATADEIANAWDFLNQGGQVDTGITNLNKSQEAYNYDTQDIISAYRQVLGRNPTQEEYVGAMATLGLDNFDRASLGTGKNTTANVAALESDPYAGRYAGYNPYDLPADAVNVSTNVLGNQVQFTNPVTQKPMVASFNNGQLVVQDGVDTMTGAEAAAAVGLAMATGGMNQQDYSALQADLKAAKSMDDVYAAFSRPQAVAALDPVFGAQTGVGKTAEQATANGAGMDALIAQLGLNNGGKLPSNKSISSAASDAGVPYQFDAGMMDTIYGGQQPSTQPTVMGPRLSRESLQSIQEGVDQFATPNYTPQELNTPAAMYGGWKDRQTLGASDGQMLGAGNANYKSSLIKSLRQNSMTPFSTNTGVQVAPNMSDAPITGWKPTDTGTTGGGAFSPEILSPRVASQQEVNDWNTYSAYRTGSIQGSTPYVSFSEWLAKGKPGIGGNTNTTTPPTGGSTTGPSDPSAGGG